MPQYHVIARQPHDFTRGEVTWWRLKSKMWMMCAKRAWTCNHDPWHPGWFGRWSRTPQQVNYIVIIFIIREIISQFFIIIFSVLSIFFQSRFSSGQGTTLRQTVHHLVHVKRYRFTWTHHVLPRASPTTIAHPCYGLNISNYTQYTSDSWSNFVAFVVFIVGEPPLAWLSPPLYSE